jgi:hypothetical protein
MSVALESSKLNPVEFCRMSQHELDELFRISPCGKIPNGAMAKGTAIFMPGTIAAPIARLVARWFIRKGKAIKADGSELLNRVTPLGVKAIRAKVSYDSSWLDGSRAILIDYSKTSFVAKKIRDEIREVAPGLYLGKVWWGKKRILDFALEV